MPRKKLKRLFLYFGSSIVILAFAGMGAFMWYFCNDPCEEAAVGQASTILISQMRQFDGVYASAANGTRTSIEYPVTVMQQILVDTQDVEVPACMQTAKDELIDYMGDAIRAFKAFQAEEPNGTIQGFLNSSYAHVRTFRIELNAVKECMPYCMPWK